MSSAVVELTLEVAQKLLSESNLSKNAVKVLVQLFNEHIDDVVALLENGFVEDFSDINFTAWFSFLTKMIRKVEKFSKLSGAEKKNVIVELCALVVRKELNVSNDIKEILVSLVHITVPSIIDQAVALTKKLHTLPAKIKKVLRKLCCCQ